MLFLLLNSGNSWNWWQNMYSLVSPVISCPPWKEFVPTIREKIMNPPATQPSKKAARQWRPDLFSTGGRLMDNGLLIGSKFLGTHHILKEFFYVHMLELCYLTRNLSFLWTKVDSKHTGNKDWCKTNMKYCN